MEDNNPFPYEEVILVDVNDHQTGIMEKQKAHLKKELHRAFSVFILNDDSEMLLQKRAYTKYHSGGLWSNSCCGHPRPGESTQSAAERRLFEEMGIKCKLTNIFAFVYDAELGNNMYEYEYDHVFIGSYSGIPDVNPEEVAEWKYLSLSDISDNLKLSPNLYTYWFQMVFNKVILSDLNRHLNPS